MQVVNEFFGISLEALKSNFGKLSKPYKLNYAITMWCQSRCLTCNIWEIKPKNELTIDEIRDFASKNTSFRWIALTGGEPFLRSDIVEIVKAFKEHSKGMYMLTIPTNSLCNPDKLEGQMRQILELKIPKVAITLSLDGHGELHDKIRGIPGNYKKVLENYRRFKELKKDHPNFSFFFGYTLSKFNEGQLIKNVEEIRNDIPEIKYSDFHINLGQTSNNYYHNTGNEIKGRGEVVVGDLEQMLKKREFEIGVMPVIERAFLKGLIQFAKTGNQPYKSKSLDASIFIDSWGNVYPSIMWDRKLANLREIGFDLNNMWHSKEAEEIRQLIKEGKEPRQWTSCEAYQTLLGNVQSLI